MLEKFFSNVKIFRMDAPFACLGKKKILVKGLTAKLKIRFGSLSNTKKFSWA